VSGKLFKNLTPRSLIWQMRARHPLDRGPSRKSA
jgi:hypothetical protein